MLNAECFSVNCRRSIHLSLQIRHLILQVANQAGELIHVPALFCVRLAQNHFCFPNFQDIFGIYSVWLKDRIVTDQGDFIF